MILWCLLLFFLSLATRLSLLMCYCAVCLAFYNERILPVSSSGPCRPQRSSVSSRSSCSTSALCTALQEVAECLDRPSGPYDK
ncbi:hypothetical protein BDV09DRAFT_98279 [Aspergillus tetrazonus]